jgi:hypothetical protein
MTERSTCLMYPLCSRLRSRPDRTCGLSWRPVPAWALIAARMSAGRQPAAWSRLHRIARSHRCRTGPSRAWTIRQSSARRCSVLTSTPSGPSSVSPRDGQRTRPSSFPRRRFRTASPPSRLHTARYSGAASQGQEDHDWRSITGSENAHYVAASMRIEREAPARQRPGFVSSQPQGGRPALPGQWLRPPSRRSLPGWRRHRLRELPACEDAGHVSPGRVAGQGRR